MYIYVCVCICYDRLLRCDGYCIFVPRLHYPGKTGRISVDSTGPPKL